MKIVVASGNPVKIKAVEQGFNPFFNVGEILAVDVPSGVSDQPFTEAETVAGARNRVNEAKQAVKDADFWVGIEGGVEAMGDTLAAFAWVVVSSAGKSGEARPVTWENSSTGVRRYGTGYSQRQGFRQNKFKAKEWSRWPAYA